MAEVRKQEKGSKTAEKDKSNSVEIPATLNVKQLADILQVSAIDVIKQLMRNGIMANIIQAEIKTNTDKKADSYFIIEVENHRHLQDIVGAIKRVKNVLIVERL